MKKLFLLTTSLLAFAIMELNAQSCSISGNFSCIMRGSLQNYTFNISGIGSNQCTKHKWEVEGGSFIVNNQDVGASICFSENLCAPECIPMNGASTSSVSIRWSNNENTAKGKIKVKSVEKVKQKIPIFPPFLYWEQEIEITLCSSERELTLYPVNPTTFSQSNVSCSNNGRATFTAQFSNPDNCGGLSFEWFLNGQSLGFGPSSQTINNLGLNQSYIVGVRIWRNGQFGKTVTRGFPPINATPTAIIGPSQITGGESAINEYMLNEFNVSNVSWTAFPGFYTQYIYSFGSETSIIFSPPRPGNPMVVTLCASGNTFCGNNFTVCKDVTITGGSGIDPVRPADPGAISESLKESAGENPAPTPTASAVETEDNGSGATDEQISLEPSFSEVQAAFSVFPNPVKAGTSVTVTLPAGISGEAAELQLWNNTGQPVWRQRVRDERFDINTSQLAPGLYFLVWQTLQHTETKRLVILR